MSEHAPVYGGLTGNYACLCAHKRHVQFHMKMSHTKHVKLRMFMCTHKACEVSCAQCEHIYVSLYAHLHVKFHVLGV